MTLADSLGSGHPDEKHDAGARGGSSHAFAALIDQGVASCTNFATGVIIGRTVPREEFGLYVLGFSIVLLLQNVQTAVLSTPLTVLMPRMGTDERRRFLGSTLVFHGVMAAASVGLLASAAAGVSVIEGAESLARVLWALTLASAFMLLREYARRVAFAALRMWTAVRLDCAVAVLQLGGLLALWKVGSVTAWGAYIVVGAACGFAGLGWLSICRRSISIRRADLFPDLRRAWKLGRWVLASVLARMASSEVFPWLIFALRGEGEVGVLGATRGIVFLANPFMLGMRNFIAPHTAHAAAEGPGRLHHTVVRMTLFMTSCLLLFVLVMIPLGGWLVATVYGKVYAGYGIVVVALSLRHLLEASAAPVSSALVAVDRARVVFVGNVAAGVTALLVGPPLVHAYGVTGAAWGMALAVLVGTAIRFAGYRTFIRSCEGKA